MMTLVTIAAALLPVTGYFLIQGEFIFTIMSIGAIVFFLSAIRATKVLGLSL